MTEITHYKDHADLRNQMMLEHHGITSEEFDNIKSEMKKYFIQVKQPEQWSDLAFAQCIAIDITEESLEGDFTMFILNGDRTESTRKLVEWLRRFVYRKQSTVQINIQHVILDGRIEFPHLPANE